MSNTSVEYEEYDKLKIQFTVSTENANTHRTSYVRYVLDIDFENISKICMVENEKGKTNVKMLVVLRKPAKVGCISEGHFIETISPFMFSRTETQMEPQIKDKPSKELILPVPEEDFMFLNYWNLKQVIVVEGQLDISKEIYDIVRDLKASD